MKKSGEAEGYSPPPPDFDWGSYAYESTHWLCYVIQTNNYSMHYIQQHPKSKSINFIIQKPP